MLTKCPECNLQVSDKARICPHCGYPLNEHTEKSTRGNFRKRMRLPNGFGQISEIRNQNLRNRFRASVTVGKRPDGRPISKLLKPKAYFKTYKDAYEALLEYNKSPYDLDDFITMQELYERWSDRHFQHLKNQDSIRAITAAWDYCESIKSMSVRNVRVKHIKNCIENGTAVRHGKTLTPSIDTQVRIKSMLNMIFDYAVEFELTDKNYARLLRMIDVTQKRKESVKTAHHSFTDGEMEILWKYKDDPTVKIILYQCYSGWRPGELCSLLIENINLEDGYVIGGMKTKAGIDRRVPIHPKIRNIIEDMYTDSVENNCKYLLRFPDSSDPNPNYEKYKRRFDRLLNALKLDTTHNPHDARKQFVTMCKKYNVDEYAIKRLVGHTIDDITERVYTDRSFEWLVHEINKIK